MSIKVKLLKWAVKTFGELDPSDIMSIREDIFNTDDPKIVQQKIVLHVKKRIGIDKNWIEAANIEGWEKTLKAIVGEHLGFDMKGSEGREKHLLSGMLDGKYKQMRLVYIYNYQFNLEVMKDRNIKEKAHVGIKPKA